MKGAQRMSSPTRTAFKESPGLMVKEFEPLCRVFNSGLMNDAVFKLSATKIPLELHRHHKHEGEDVGLCDTVITAKDYRLNL